MLQVTVSLRSLRTMSTDEEHHDRVVIREVRGGGDNIDEL